MDYQEAVANLIRLLCCNVTELPYQKVSELVRKRYLLWHPDKNSGNTSFCENLMCLNESWNRYKKGQNAPSSPGPDIFCHETWDPSWESESDNESDYNSTPFDDDFFNASPKKHFAIPDELRVFFRSTSNRRAGKLFLLFGVQNEQRHLEAFSSYSLLRSLAVWETRTNKDIFIAILVLHNEQRLLDVKKVLKRHQFSNIELFYAVNILSLNKQCCEIFKEPFLTKGETIGKAPERVKNFNHRQLVDFAISHQIKDSLSLMYEYAHLAEVCDRMDCTKDHEDDHRDELENAILFVNLSDRRRTAKNACECVIAKLYAQLSQISNLKWFESRCVELGDSIIEDKNLIELAGHGWLYSNHIIGTQKFDEIVKYVLEGFFKNIPKKRYCALVGNFNCGKTTFASSLCKILDGINININITKDRLPFYLGSAIGKRFVLFDDVKGQKFVSPPKLPTGYGLSNLDDLRDHLDGHIEVQLEKKNQNPVNQVFPCGIITMNNYIMPASLLKRVKMFKFSLEPSFFVHKPKINFKSLFIAMALNNLVPCEPHVLEELFKAKSAWLTQHDPTCLCMNKEPEDMQTHDTSQPSTSGEGRKRARKTHPEYSKRPRPADDEFSDWSPPSSPDLPELFE